MSSTERGGSANMWGELVLKQGLTFVAALSVVVLGGASVTAAAQSTEAPTLDVTGQIVVVADGPGNDGHRFEASGGEVHDDEVHEFSASTTYFVVTDAGQFVSLDADFDETVVSGDRFEGQLVVSPEVADALDVPAGASVEVDSTLGTLIVEQATESSESFAVQSSVVLPPVAEAFTPTAHTVDVVVANLGSYPSTGARDSSVNSLMSTIGAYWLEETDGAISSFTRPNPIRTLSGVSCDGDFQTALGTIWGAAAAAHSRTLNYYLDGGGQHLAVILPESCETTLALGVGTIGTIHDGGLVIVSNAADLETVTFAHEIGHNLGLGHNNVSYCGSAIVSEGAQCSIFEYDDIYGVMGAAIFGYGTSLTALPAPQRHALDAYQAGERLDHGFGPNPIQVDTYTLNAASSSGASRAIRVKNPVTGQDFFVELRSGTGADSGAYYNLNDGFCPAVSCPPGGVQTRTGVRVLAADTSVEGAGVQTTVFSVATNAADPLYAYMALRSGEQFVSGDGGVTVRVVSLSPNSTNPTSAVVRVSTGGWTSTTAPEPTVGRIQGADRFATSAAIAQQFSTADVVYIANGRNFPDALSAAPAAGKNNGPLLLTERDVLPELIAAQLERLAPDRIVIAGGQSAVSAEVEAAIALLVPGAAIDRFAGNDRYETSRLVSADAFAGTGVTPSGNVFVATGVNFPDALSASAAARSLDAPVILVPGGSADLDDDTAALLTQLSPTTVYIAGGPNAVSNGIQSDLVARGGTVERLFGASRYDTSVAINAEVFGPTNNAAYVAVGNGFADALSGAALAGREGAPLFVVQPSCVPGSAVDLMQTLGVDQVTIFGGVFVLTRPVDFLSRCAA